MEYNKKTNTHLAPLTYNIVIGLTIIWGFIVNWFMIYYVDMTWLITLPSWVFIIGYFAVVMTGVKLFQGSDQPAVSFLGYNIVVLAFGSILSIVFLIYDIEIIQRALVVTGGFTIIMMLLGATYPTFFERIIGVVTIVVLSVIILELVMVIFFKTHAGWIDYVVAMAFCGYIAYDWGKALRMPKTLDNAIDSAARLYMDIINLFIRIVRIMGKR